jgi:two-component system phosphate regulon sensor histidine kinase PhoR
MWERRRSVWIVDDSRCDAEHARRVLAGDYETHTFDDGSTVLEQLAGGARPDVMILDWLMPGVSGLEVCEFVRSRPDLAPLQVLLLTAQTQPERTIEGLSAGANDFLQKPFSDAELRARVGALVRARSLLERAERAEAQLRALLEHAPDAIIGVDAEGRVMYANPEAERALGGRGVMGAPIGDVLPSLAGALAGLREGVAQPLDDVTLGDRTYAVTVRSHHGHADRTIIALRDVTEQRQEEARRADFYAIVAHDLRSPLTAIALRVDLILRGARGLLPASLIEDIRRIETNTRGLVALISDFLDLARIEGTSGQLTFEEVDLSAVAGKVIADLEPLTEAKQLDLRLDAPSQCASLLGDATRLTQMVMNLVGNAIKFTPEGGRITVEIAHADGFVTLAVEDTGVGIPADQVSRVFDRFARADAVRGSTPGTGLGLTIVREIVIAHGGDVGVESTPGQGSRFWVRLPTRPDPARPLRDKVPALRSARTCNGS